MPLRLLRCQLRLYIAGNVFALNLRGHQQAAGDDLGGERVGRHVAACSICRLMQEAQRQSGIIQLQALALTRKGYVLS